MKPLNPGDFRHRVSIQASTTVRQADGGNVPTWATFATVSCEIKPLAGRQLALAQASSITSTSTHQIRMRWRPDLEMNHRLLFRVPAVQGSPGRVFAINSTNNTEERRVELVLTVTEQVA